MAICETSVMSHEEPGGGVSVIPESSEPDIENGWRRESPPAAFPEYADPFMTPVFATMPELPYEAE